MTIKSKKLRESAKGEKCTVNLAGVCNYDTETTVLAHLPFVGKMGGKVDDFCAGFACSNCHDVIDGRVDPNAHGVHPDEWLNHREFYSRRAMYRTIKRWVEMELVVIK